MRMEMRILWLVVISCLGLEGIAHAARCSNNPCLRAIASKKGNRNGAADCVSFVQAAARSTRTVTTTLTVTSNPPRPSTNPLTSPTYRNTSATTIAFGPQRLDDTEYEEFDAIDYARDAKRSRTTTSRSSRGPMPTYASAPCSSSLPAYSSACSCIGISTAKAPQTMKPQTTTVTVTRTVSKPTSSSSSRMPTNSPSKSSSRISSTASSNYGGIGPQTSSGAPSSSVYVIKSTTLVASSQSIAANVSSAISTGANSTTGRYWNATASSAFNLTSSSRPSFPSNTSIWHNVSTTRSWLANSTRPIWLNTSMPTLGSNSTTGRWLNTTRAVPTMFQNSTSVRWPNSTVHANATTPRWLNTTSTPTATPTPTIDTSCGETASPFALQIAQPGGKFDGWFLYLSGNTLLFTGARDSARLFSVEATGHLCAVGYSDADKRPAVAAIGVHDPTSNVWLLRKQTLDSFGSDYAAITCSKGEGALSCIGNSTSRPSHWLGCGLQLELTSEEGETVPVNGINCTSIALKPV